MDNDFDSVSWQNEGDSEFNNANATSDPQTLGSKKQPKAASEQDQAGPYADQVDLAGVGTGRLDCNVNSPLKENDGTKDAYVSYLVTTQVCLHHTLASLESRSC